MIDRSGSSSFVCSKVRFLETKSFHPKNCKNSPVEINEINEINGGFFCNFWVKRFSQVVMFLKKQTLERNQTRESLSHCCPIL